MTALIALSLLAVAVALVRGGSFVGWARVNVRWSPAAIGSMVVLLLLYNPPIDRQEWAMAWGPAVWIACMATLLAVLLRNAFLDRAARTAWAVAAVGVGLNMLVVAANDGLMPQSGDAWRLTHGETASAAARPEPHLRNITPMNDQTRLSWLGDVIPEPTWAPNTNVVSIGDLLLGLGLGGWAYAVTRKKGMA
jgi:hypothetical protein